MTKKTNKIRREAIEAVAVQTHSMLTEARRQQDNGNWSIGFILARQCWFMSVYVAHKRSLTTNRKMAVNLSTGGAIRTMHSLDHITSDKFDQLKDADRIAVMGTDAPNEGRHLIDQGLWLLESTEAASVTRRREQAAQGPRRRLGPRSLATAASGLLTLGSSS
ncbi:MAG: hypothetical protein AAF664_26240 [Planctomycetota bacterium]